MNEFKPELKTTTSSFISHTVSLSQVSTLLCALSSIIVYVQAKPMTSAYAPIALEDQAPKPYSFQYGVKDDYAKTNFAHTESQDAQVSFWDSQLRITLYFFRVRWREPMWLLFLMEESRQPPTLLIISMVTLPMSLSKESPYILQRRGLLLNCYTFGDFVKS